MDAAKTEDKQYDDMLPHFSVLAVQLNYTNLSV